MLKAWLVFWFALTGVLIVIGPLELRRLACQPEGPRTWSIEGQTKPDKGKNPPTHSTYTVKENKPDASGKNKDAYEAYESLVCGELKVTDLALIWFTCGLVIVGYFTMRSVDATARRTERAYLICAGVYGVPLPGINPSGPEYRGDATHFTKPWLMMIHNLGKTPGYVKKVQFGIARRRDFMNVVHLPVTEVLRKKMFRTTTIRIHEMFAPSEKPRYYRYIRMNRKVATVFFGRIDYLDVYGEEHHSTFALLHRLRHTDTIGESYSKDWS